MRVTAIAKDDGSHCPRRTCQLRCAHSGSSRLICDLSELGGSGCPRDVEDRLAELGIDETKLYAAKANLIVDSRNSIE
jgi:hypothetical protein